MPSVTKQSATKQHAPGKPGGVLSRIKGIEFDPDEGIKILIYGRSGTGKTTIWGTFPGQILATICSGGMRPGELRSLDTPEHRKKIKQVAIEKSTEVREIIEYQVNGAGFKTVVLDHASGLQDRVLAEIVGMDEIPAQKSWGLASQQQYGQVALQCKEHFRGFLNLACNVVIIAQERDFNTESEGSLITPTVGAALTPSLAGWLYPACDYVINTFIRQKTETKVMKVGGKEVRTTSTVGGVEFCARISPNPVYVTKFRVPKGNVLPEVIVDPDYAKIMRVIRGEGG
jgi:energy-coupling factor transporter ATP-binding protein EcfA2